MANGIEVRQSFTLNLPADVAVCVLASLFRFPSLHETRRVGDRIRRPALALGRPRPRGAHGRVGRRDRRRHSGPSHLLEDHGRSRHPSRRAGRIPAGDGGPRHGRRDPSRLRGSGGQSRRHAREALRRGARRSRCARTCGVSRGSSRAERSRRRTGSRPGDSTKRSRSAMKCPCPRRLRTRCGRESRLLDGKNRRHRRGRSGASDPQSPGRDHPRHVHRDLRLGPPPLRRLRAGDEEGRHPRPRVHGRGRRGRLRRRQPP